MNLLSNKEVIIIVITTISTVISGILIYILQERIKKISKNKKNDLRDYILTIIKVKEYSSGNNEVASKITKSLIEHINKDVEIDFSTKKIFVNSIVENTAKSLSSLQKQKPKILKADEDSLINFIIPRNEGFIIEITNHTPYVSFVKESNTFTIKGFVRPDNVMKFFKPIVQWVESLSDNICNETFTVNIMLTYCNSASYKFILDILLSTINLRNSGRKIIINWYSEEGDDEMYESGNELQEILNFKFNYFIVPRIE